MPQRKLGPTGLSVGCIGMGCMPLSNSVDRPAEEDAIKTIHAAYELGITLFDTADAYCLDASEKGHNERLLAKALKDCPGAVIATKGGRIRPEGRWVPAARPDDIRRACKDSLSALGAEAIVLYQLHWPDPQVPFSETIGALADLRREGKIVNVGLSNVSVDQLEEARGIVEIVSVQNRLNLFDRSSAEVLERCEELGLAFLPYSPLTGKSGVGSIGDNKTLSEIASVHKASPQQIALAWLLQLSPVVIPIPGASRIASLTGSARSVSVELTDGDVARLNEIGRNSRA